MNLLNNNYEYYQICREERNLVTVLYSLLINDESNFAKFISLFSPDLLKESFNNYQIYTEYAFLRDLWNQFTVNRKELIEKNNELKKKFIREFMDYNSIQVRDDLFYLSVKDFNNYFGCNSTKHIQSPSNWSVEAINENIYDIYRNANDFELLCKFKWSFNIKPDLVIILNDGEYLGFEAKLESIESGYPSNPKEKRIWNNVFGERTNRIKQTELQEFMFKKVLKIQSVSLFIIDKAGKKENTVAWQEIFNLMTIKNSFLNNFISKNNYIK